MERRKALTIAGVVTATLATASIAMAANLGLLGLAGADDEGPGQLDAGNVADLVDAVPLPSPAEAVGTGAEQDTEVVVVDEYVTEPASPGPVANPVPADTFTDPAPEAAGRATPEGGMEDHEPWYDDEHEDDEHEDDEDDEHEDDEHEDDEHEEHEGDDDEHEEHEGDDDDD